MNLATFRIRYPEFRATADAMVTDAIEQAGRMVDSVEFGDLASDAIGYKAAYLLATSPFGMTQRLEDDKTAATYEKRFQEIRKARIIGMRVV